MKSFILVLCLGLVVAAYAFPSGESSESEDDASAPAPVVDEDDDYDDYNNSPATDPEEAEPPVPDFGRDDDFANNTISGEENAPAPEEPVLEFDELKDLVNEFSNYSRSTLNTEDLLKRVTELEKQIQRSSQRLSSELEKERNQVGQLGYLLLQIREVKAKLFSVENNINSLTSAAQHLGREQPYVPEGLQFDLSRGTNHRSWATLYRSRGHSGRAYELDFRTCSVFENCCKNLADLDNDSQSIHTHDTCVEMFDGRDCTGDSREFYPGSSANHQDFGSYNDRFSSGRPCNRS